MIFGMKTGHMILTTPLLGVICRRMLGFDKIYLLAKFDGSSFSRYRDIIGGVKIESASRDPDHAPFKGDFPS